MTTTATHAHTYTPGCGVPDCADCEHVCEACEHARTLPAQATISTPSGWTVTVTHMRTDRDGMLKLYNVWAVAYTSPTMEGTLVHPLTTPHDGEPNPMAALEKVGAYMHTTTLPELQPGRAELADAIAGMWGE